MAPVAHLWYHSGPGLPQVLNLPLSVAQYQVFPIPGGGPPAAEPLGAGAEVKAGQWSGMEKETSSSAPAPG